MSFVITSPEGIRAWQLLAFYHMAQLELRGMHHSSGRRATVEIRRIMKSTTRDRAKLLAEYRTFLIEKGILIEEQKAAS